MATNHKPTVYRSLQGEIKAETGKAILFVAMDADGNVLKQEWFPKSQISSFGGTYDEVDGTFQFILASEWILGQKGLLSSSTEVAKVPSYMQKMPTPAATTSPYNGTTKQDKANRLPYKDDEGQESDMDDWFEQLRNQEKE